MRAPVLAPSGGAAPGVSVSLDAPQRRIVEWRGPGVCVVLGSPGTGATTAITHAAAARLGDVPADEVLVLGRDRDSVRGLRAGIAALRGSGALPAVTTFHGLAYALVQRSFQGDPDAVQPRLLSGAEEDVRIRDLLRGAIEDGDIAWPPELLAASSTLGFANDLRALLARSRELGLDGERLAAIAQDAGMPAWASLARFSEIESGVMALEGVVDYTRLLEAAIDAVPRWGQPLRYVYADDFHEAGPLQRELLECLVRRGAAALITADPDLSAFAFRGADRLGAIDLARSADADIVVLDQVHAGGGAVRRAYESVRRQPGLPGLNGDAVRAYRHPRCADESPASTVAVVSHDSWSDLAAWIADDLVRRHLGLDGDPAPWESMAIIGRSTAHLDSLRRALDAVGVPVRIDAGDIPLQAEPAVATLLAAVTLALTTEAEPRAAGEFLAGPLVGLDPLDLRVLSRALRQSERRAHPSSPVPPGIHLVRDALVDAREGDSAPDSLESARERAALERVRGAGALLRGIRDRAESGAPPAEVLWEAWSGALSGADGVAWPERLRRSALSGHAPSGHDVDAVIALFATAERLSDRYAGVVGIRGLLSALEGQRVPAEKVAHHLTGAPAVSLMTAHRAVGRHWDHVVIVGAQEGSWPPFLGGSSVLRLAEWDALARGEDASGSVRASAAERLAQERRLFALAVSRANRTLVVATVASDDEEPSRFAHDLGVDAAHRPGRPPRPLTLDGLVAELRSATEDPCTSPALRAAAVQRLALLADAVDDSGARLAPRADPDTWWGLAEPSPGVEPVRSLEEPVTLSGSGLVALGGCPARWFLSRVVHAEGPRGRAMAVGSIVHALAEWSARGDLAPDRDALLAAMDQVWAELPFDAPWEEEAERRDVGDAIERLCAYLRQTPRRMLAVEHRFRVSIPLRDPVGEGADTHVVVGGLMDRIEIDDEGRVHIVDFKTGRVVPSGPAVEADPQLAIYQEAVRHGALDGLLGADADCAGASLVQLRADASGSPGTPRIQPQAPLAAGSWLHDDMADAVRRIRAEDFPAVPSGECRTCAYVAACPAQIQGQQVGR